MTGIIYRIRWRKGFEERWDLYKIICKNPEITIDDLTKMINWSAKKVEYYVNRLIKEGLIRKSTRIVNGYAPKTVKELIN